MDIATIIKTALGLFGQILGSDDAKIKADTDLQQKALEAKMALAALQSQLENKSIDLDIAIIQGQTEINKIDAESDDKYRSRGRPTVVWICAIGLGYTYLVKPFIASLMAISILFGADQHLVNAALQALPVLDNGMIMGLIVPLLGIGGFRTYEKVRGVK